jgi:hypothetical protein
VLTIAGINRDFADTVAQKEDIVVLEIPFMYPGIDDLDFTTNGS